MTERNDVAKDAQGQARPGDDRGLHDPSVTREAGSGDHDRAISERNGHSRKETVHKRSKKSARKGLADLLEQKNEHLRTLENELDKLRQDIAAKEDRLLRLAAEFENYKKRTRREWELHQKQANAGLIAELLNVLDDFDRALEASGDPNDHFHSGVRLIYTGLMDILRKTGLKEVESAGSRFDPQYHEAVGEIESGEVEEGTIAHVVQKGYVLHDVLLRPARVIVAKGKSPE